MREAGMEISQAGPSGTQDGAAMASVKKSAPLYLELNSDTSSLSHIIHVWQDHQYRELLFFST